MNTGQVMFTIGAMILLSVITLTEFANLNNSGRQMNQAQAGLTATTIATSMIERAQATWFDNITDTSGAVFDTMQSVMLSYLTPANKLGTEPGEGSTIDDWNDFDDFNGKNVDVTPGYMNEKYRVHFVVYYVSPTNINLYSSTQTFVKRMDITVWRTYPPPDTSNGKNYSLFDTVRVSTIFGYYKFSG